MANRLPQEWTSRMALPVIAACGVMMIGLYVLGRMLGKADEARGEGRGFEVIE